jgi:plastocyanin
VLLRPSGRPARLGALGLSLAAVIALAPANAAARTATVTMNDSYVFSPVSVSVGRGDSVRWRNDAQVTDHDVKSTLAGYFTSGRAGGMGPGDSFTFTFRSAGMFGYVCRIHDGMAGVVTVPMTVTKLTGPVRFRLTVASGPVSGAWRHVVEVRKPGSGTWTAVQATTAPSVLYTPTKRGTYDFRSSLRNTSTGRSSTPSPVVSATF